MSNPQPQAAWNSLGVCGTAATERLSLDQSRVLMKWDGPTPQYFAGVTTYTHSEIIAILSSPEWTYPDPEEPGS
jgi:hypothetical protein